MKPNLQTIKEDIAELKNSHEALEIVVKTLVKNVANFEVRLKGREECSRNKPKDEVIINQMVKGHKDAIDVIEVKLKILEKENDTKMLKVCRYHNRGYCKQKQECKFYHAQNVCESVSRNELCVLKSCSERHPKTCKHWKRGECRRGQSCAYSHQEIYKQKNPDIEIYNENPKPKPNEEILKDAHSEVCDTCSEASKDETALCSLCKGICCQSCKDKMQLWKRENHEFCEYVRFPVNSTICSRCVEEKTPRRAMEQFELATNVEISLPIMHFPEEECQGSGIYQHEVQCTLCNYKYCRKCIQQDHPQNIHICLNCEL